MKKRAIVLIVLALIALLIVVDMYRRERHDRPIKQELVAISNNEAVLRERVAEMKERGGWADGRVGVTGDGYVFCYDIYDSHTGDYTKDSNLVYLPDEKRFVRCRVHYCIGIENARQPRDKGDLLQMLTKEPW